jgi:DNA-binding response OmpR family regulator
VHDRTILNNLRVLVVDDDQDTRDLLRYFLQSHGATATLTDNVTEALELVSKDHPDVVVSDISMPDYNGYALVAAIRKQGAAMPIVALTAFTSERDREMALSSGFTDYIAKPFEPEELISTIKKVGDAYRQVDHGM